MSAFLIGLGILGAALLILAYTLQQRGVLAASSKPFLGLNVVGSGLVMASAIAEWNLGVVVLEGAWMALSLWKLAHTRTEAA